MSTQRNYERFVRDVTSAVRPSMTRSDRMKAFVDIAWDHFSHQGVSWIGFYAATHGQLEMTLLERRDKPACSPIGLHGACGRSWRNGRVLIVTDVKNLGEGYIACDPRDRSEVVLPMVESDGSCWGVLDADSHEVGAFDATDARGLWSACAAAGLTVGPMPEIENA